MREKMKKDFINLEKFGQKIDFFIESANEKKLTYFLQECLRLQEIVSKSQDKVSLFYFEANIHAALHAIKSNNESYLWSWEQPESTDQILALRKAIDISEPNSKNRELIRFCQIKVNLANCLVYIGRIVEAIEQYDHVLSFMPKFLMALGNRASAINKYGEFLFNSNHAKILFFEAYKGYDSALQPDTFWDGTDRYLEQIREIFKNDMKKLKSFSKNQEKFYVNDKYFFLGSSEEERNYRNFCLEKKLFLNPLNDLGFLEFAACDDLILPSHTYSISDESYFVRFYDLLKQEFVGARVIYFESISMKNFCLHFTDKKVLLFNQFDGNLYGLKYEKLKAAFRIAYSIFDKIAVFINEYFYLNKKSKNINFRNVWYRIQPNVHGKVSSVLEDKFLKVKNPPLRGLFSLSKDIFDPNFQLVSEPEAKYLNDLRNALEHRFLSIHHYDDKTPSTEIHSRITDQDFYEKTLRILKLVRAALIYLGLAMHIEESLRNQNENNKTIKLTKVGIPLSR